MSERAARKRAATWPPVERGFGSFRLLIRLVWLFDEADEVVKALWVEGAGEEADVLVHAYHSSDDLAVVAGAAAIASRAAAAVYRARILQRNLEDHRENYTRFVLLARSATVARRANKVSLVFSTRNLPGALYKCLSVFALRDISLTKMESRPLRGRPWEYLFYVDFLGHVKEERCRNALAHLSEVTDFLRILGCYRSAHR